jgi:hypothetical protein
MGIFDKIFGKGKTSETVQKLQALKSKISEIPQRYQTGAFVTGPGVGQVREQIPIICRNIDDAIRALKTGLDPYNRPITKPQIADGLKRLVDQTRRPAFIGVISTVLRVEGVSELEKYMNELEQIAGKIR